MATLRTDANAPPADPRSRDASRWRRVGRGGLWVLGGLLTLATLALAGTALLDAREQRRPPPGELVDLPDGRKLHLQISGEEHAGPTVVLDAGQGMFSPSFAWLQAALAEQATVVAYDRPGYGWSTPADRPVDAGATADDLHAALTSRSLEGPYLLVGHSLGAFYVRAFAARYPEQTLGLVLLDPAHEQQLERLPADALVEFEQADQMFRWASRMARLGLFRLHNPQHEATGDLPEAASRQIVMVSAAARYWQTAGAELEGFERLAAAAPRGFGEVPVTLVSGGRDVPDGPQVREVLDELDRELVSRTPGIAHHIVEDADHLTLLTVDEHARVVSELIADLLPRAAAR
jgi:pimeloyl-ACP methyl ester carboxylesterase